MAQKQTVRIFKIFALFFGKFPTKKMWVCNDWIIDAVFAMWTCFPILTPVIFVLVFFGPLAVAAMCYGIVAGYENPYLGYLQYTKPSWAPPPTQLLISNALLLILIGLFLAYLVVAMMAIVWKVCFDKAHKKCGCDNWYDETIVLHQHYQTIMGAIAVQFLECTFLILWLITMIGLRSLIGSVLVVFLLTLVAIYGTAHMLSHTVLSVSAIIAFFFQFIILIWVTYLMILTATMWNMSLH